MTGPDREFTRRMVLTVLTVAAVLVGMAVLWVARTALMLIYVSTIIAMGFSPLVRVLQGAPGRRHERGVPRTLAILAIYLVVVAAFTLVTLAVVPPLVQQARELGTRAPRVFAELQDFLIEHRILTGRITFEEAVQRAPGGGSGQAVTAVWAALLSVIGGLFGIGTILILSFYLLLEARSLFDQVTRVLPEGGRARFVHVSQAIVKKVSAWLSAQFILAVLMGAFSAAGLSLMGVPYFYVVALVAAVGETIPIVGPIVAGVTAVVVALTASPKLALIAGSYFLVLHQLEANVLVPKIMERRVGVSPVVVIVALLIGGELWGLLGAILAVPTAAIVTAIVSEMSGEAPA
jgi:predicted PurR-regulated permease PerM